MLKVSSNVQHLFYRDNKSDTPEVCLVIPTQAWPLASSYILKGGIALIVLKRMICIQISTTRISFALTRKILLVKIQKNMV